MERPYLSIIVTVYNTAPFLEQCLDSIVKQTFINREILLINDGSTDQSEEICKRYCEKYQDIRLISQENGGASAARNTGLRAARGEYIHFIDSDDFLIMSNLYEELYSGFCTICPEIIFCRCEELDSLTLKKVKEQEVYRAPKIFDTGSILLHVLQEQYTMTLTCPVNKLFKRSFLIENNLFFAEGLDHEEDEWLPRVVSCAKIACFSNEIIYGVRLNRNGSLSQTINEFVAARKARSKMKIAVSGMKYMKSKNLDELTLRYVAGYYWRYMIAAVVATQKLRDHNLKKENFSFIKANRSFFKNRNLLLNRNWRLMGWMFDLFGIRFTAKILSFRY